MTRKAGHITTTDREAAIEALGAAADASLAEPPVATTDPRVTLAAAARANRPASSLLRWEHHEDLRDAVIDHAKREHHSVHTALIESIRRGLSQIDSQEREPRPSQTSRSSSPARSSWERRGRSVVIEVRAQAYQEADETWTIEIPRLTSKSPSGATIVATGSASTSREIAQAALDLASAWLGVGPTEVAVHVTVGEP